MNGSKLSTFVIMLACTLATSSATAASAYGEHVFTWMPWNTPIDRNNGNAPPRNFSFCFDGNSDVDCTSTLNVRFFAVGQYQVKWTPFNFAAAQDSGIAQGYGGDKYCSLSFGGSAAFSTPANIRCFNSLGQPAHTPFLFRKQSQQLGPGFTIGPSGWGLVGARGGFTNNFNTTLRPLDRPTDIVAWYGPNSGRYIVLFKGLQSVNGTAHVASSPANNRCVVTNWFGDFDLLFGETITVSCFAPSGLPADTAFHVLFEDNQSGRVGRASPLAYGFADAPDASASVGAARSFTDRGSAILINPVFNQGSRVVGARDVVFSNYSSRAQGSHFLVTAGDPQSNYCVTQFWVPAGNDLLLRVHCFDRFGRLSDTRFSFAMYAAIP